MLGNKSEYEMTIRPDGVHPLHPKLLHEVATYRNVTVQILEDDAGNVSIGWKRQPNTEEIEDIDE